jgi:transcriptional regulator with XRE-family HTH domain
MLQSLNRAMPEARKFRRTFIRQWRSHRRLTLEQLAERMERIAAKRDLKLPTTASHLSMLERGQRGYTQDTIEALAEALETDVGSILIRDPTDPESIWPAWDEAKPSQRRQIVEVVKALLKTGS